MPIEKVDEHGHEIVERRADEQPERLPYLSESEKKNLKVQIQTGRMTFFRLSKCKREGCEEQVPKAVPYCSRTCASKNGALNLPAPAKQDDEEDYYVE